MALTISGDGANSYNDLASATAIAEDYNLTTWLDATVNTSPEAVLITSALVLNSLSYSGDRLTASQQLAFPRSGYYTRDGYQTAYPKDGSDNYITPMAVKKAQMYQAEYLLRNQDILFASGGVAEAEIGDLKVKGIVAPGQIPGIVYQLLSPYTYGGDGDIDSHLITRSW